MDMLRNEDGTVWAIKPVQNAAAFHEVTLENGYNLFQYLGDDAKYAEVTDRQLSFLCGLLQQTKPEKIVEIGVSAGATTAMIARYLSMPDMHPERVRFYSVDISERYYQNPEFETGYISKRYEADLTSVWHEYCVGDVCAAFLDHICADGAGIDFLFLDAAHSLPGEVLDFIVCLPYLNPDAMVVMHDVTLSLLPNVGDCIATGTLFSAVCGKKYYMPGLEGREKVSNIAAFRVTDDTARNIQDLFFLLSQRWAFLPDRHSLAQYRNVIDKAYDNCFKALFDQIVVAQKKRIFHEKIPVHLGASSVEKLKELWPADQEVYIYGTGVWGNLYYDCAKFLNLKVKAMLVSDGRDVLEDNRREFEVPILHFSEIPSAPTECSIILAMEGNSYDVCFEMVEKQGYRILNRHRPGKAK